MSLDMLVVSAIGLGILFTIGLIAIAIVVTLFLVWGVTMLIDKVGRLTEKEYNEK